MKQIDKQLKTYEKEMRETACEYRYSFLLQLYQNLLNLKDRHEKQQ